MAKKLPFDQMSDVRCEKSTCNCRLKARFEERGGLCYRHYRQTQAGRGHFINHAGRKKRIEDGLTVKAYGGQQV